MDVRGKLVELLRNSPHLDVVKGYKNNDCTFKQGADWLIANGVTVQEWISVKDRFPEPGERVLVCIGAVFEAFIDDAGKWQRYYSAPLNEVLGEPTHWMPLPQPPEGE